MGAQEAIYILNTLTGKNEEQNEAKEFANRVKGYAPKWRPFLGTAQPLNQYPPELRAEMIEQLNTNQLARDELSKYVSDLWTTHFDDTKPEGHKFIQDGIIRPNGQITQVAPDDWVFAARNIGDLASAFIPESLIHQHTMNAPQDIVINQTINITTPTDLLPQTIKEQAHSGAYDALNQVMTEGHRRLALMTGIR